MAMIMITNFRIYFILLFILGMLLLFFTNQNLYLEPKEITIEISLPDQINICTADEGS
jgi:hypothetical protein